MINSFLLVCFVISGVSIPVHSFQDTLKEDFQDTLKEDLELERQLKLINKPPIKTIHRKPSFQKSSTKNLGKKPNFKLERVKCPTGFIPVRRTTKEDLIREKKLLNKSILVQGAPSVHLAELALSSKFSPYYGVEGRNSVYNPRVTKGQMSLSHVWVQNGPNNKISLGWQVSQDLYGDNKTHLYASWTRDNFHKTGCYNVRCPGIVHTNSEIYLGQHVGATSSYGGPIFDFDNYISMHAVTKDWWIQANGEDIGYYPAKLFSNLTSADKVGWGGRTLTPHGSHSPPMGAGHFPDNDLYHSSYFRTISFENAIRIKNGPEIYQTEKYVDKPNCFGLKYYGNLHGIAGYMVQFGGPGGMCDD
ncbi:uncharacterized protein LOC108340454 [Vigna angularis]|uniref:uncharacterized protein LOC108340454 n=1 Tax=Phaseolus angularis TaxID=3914 RepID=UPI000809BF0C|nr:uncharacterized protein LOC108340454 [Vigna angularis]